MKLAALRPQIRFDKKWSDVAASLLHVAAFVLGGFLLARWIWLLFSPTIPLPPLASEQATSSQSNTILSGHWFVNTSSQMATLAPVAVNFKLVGIYAPSSDKLGFAVFKLADGKQRAVLLHQEITAGIVLRTILPESVKVGQEGSMQTLVLESRTLTDAGTSQHDTHLK